MAKGSEQKYGENDKRVCAVCEKKIRLKDQTSIFCHDSKLGSFTVCGDCSWPEVREKLKAATADAQTSV